MMELVENLTDDIESLYVERMDCDLESVITSVTSISASTSVSTTIVPTLGSAIAQYGGGYGSGGSRKANTGDV